MKNIRWAMGGYITFVHILGLYGLFYAMPQCKAAAAVVGLCPVADHGLWHHRRRAPVVGAPQLHGEAALPLHRHAHEQLRQPGLDLALGTRDHRTHHFHSETVADPHDAIRGFVFAHIGWLYLKKDKRVAEAGNMVNMDDLREDGFVMWQKKYDPWWNLFWCFGMPAIVASRVWGERFMNAFMVAGAEVSLGASLHGECSMHALYHILSFRHARLTHSLSLFLLLCLLVQWLVNSAAHLWGERPYDPKSNPAENPLVAIASIGEGWHNWHHKYPFDYAASE